MLASVTTVSNPFAQLKTHTLTTAERAEQLDRAWASEFAWRELETLANYTESYAAPKGTTLVREGSRESFMGIVLQGLVDVVKADGDGVGRSLAQIRPGKTFGEMALVDGEPRSATLVTAVDTVVLVITKEALDRLAEDAPRLALKFTQKLARQISQRLRQTSGVLSDRMRD
jgi:CRP-like cAMP-binding protein